jgi:hypothetical protein
LDNREAKALEFSRARPDFTTAINRYKGAITNLENRLKKVDAKDPLAAELTRSKAQAELDAAVLRYDLGLTFIGDDERGKRGEEIDKAMKEFDAIANKYANTRIGYLANVWSSQCSFMNGSEAKAIMAIDAFTKANRANREAADAIRLAGFFGIEHVYQGFTEKDTTPAAKFARTEQAAIKWLQTYPEARNTPEGLGARYRQALMKELQAFLPGGVIFQEAPKPKAPPKSATKGKEKEAPPPQRKIVGISANAKQHLEDANKIYKGLTDTDNEYSDRAHRHRLTNQLIILEAEGRGGDPPLKSINTLEQAYLAAQVQQARIYDLPKSGKTEQQQEAEEKQRVKKAIEYLERGLQRVSPKDSPRDIFDAQMLQVQFLSKQDRAIEAAVLGEGLARNNPRLPRASVAAALAVYAYNSSLARLKESPARTDEAEDADIRRIVNLAEFAEKTWPNDGPTDAIRHVLAFYQSNRDNNYDLAWQTYGRIGTGYTEIYQARREMAAAMFYLIRPDERDPKKYRDALAEKIKERSRQFQATLAALEAMPEPPASVPPHQAESWAGAKTMQAQLYYMNSDYNKVDAVVKATTDALKKFAALDAKKRDDLAYTIRGLKYNALQGRAAEFIKAKEFAKVGETLGAELDALKKELKAPPAEETPGLARMRRAQRDFLIVCMSAYVQNKQADQATELLDALQGSGGSLEQNVATMRSLNVTIQNQIASLNKEGKKQDADDLARSFTDFLDKIKGDDANIDKLPNGVILFLGQGYAAVGQAARAAELFDQLIKKPFEPTGKTEAEKEDSKAKHAVYVRQMEYLQARAYRQAGTKADFEKATALMQKIVGDPLKKTPRGWGYSNIEIRKEYCMLLEDQKLFNAAGQNWRKLMNDFVPGGLPPQVKFLGQRPAFEAFGKAVDEMLFEAFLVPSQVSILIAHGFKDVYPNVAAKRNQLRLVYFDLFFESYRCHARCFSDPEMVAKVKGGQDRANQILADVGQKFFELLIQNEDVPPEVRENIKELLDKHPPTKKRFDELLAAAPKS